MLSTRIKDSMIRGAENSIFEIYLKGRSKRAVKMIDRRNANTSIAPAKYHI